MEKSQGQITILHFNDVYNIEEKKKEPVGGAARFKTALESFRDTEPLILFSGDLFEPSLLSTAYDGEQMIKPMNDFNVDVACFGNHEFSLDLDVLTEYIQRIKFPWLISNVKTKADWKPIAAGKEYFTLERKGMKFGFMGLAEGDWVHEVPTLDLNEIAYEDFIKCAKRLNLILREVEKCDFVIALTHMRNPNDIKLAKEFDGLDLILGGHDHINLVEKVNGTYIIKSGSDFVEFNKISLTLLDKGSLESLPLDTKGDIYKDKYLIEIKNVEVTKKYDPHPEVEAHVKKHLEQFEEKMKIPVLFSEVELETRFEKVRSSEQNFPNLLADILRLDSGCDCALINSGTFRSDRLFEPGVLTLGDIRLILPWEDMIMKVKVTGEQLWKALENGVCDYPSLNGKFLSVRRYAVSGVTFSFDPSKEGNSRIPVESIMVNGKPIDLSGHYTMATMLWVYHGRDGFTVFSEVIKLNEENVAEEIHTILKKFFTLTKDPQIIEEHKKDDPDALNLHTMDFFKPPSLQRRISEVKRMDFYQKLKPIIRDIILVDGSYLISVAPTIENRIKVL